MIRPPRVSALMVTRAARARRALIEGSLACYCAQTLASRELVIVVDAPRREDLAWLKSRVRELGRRDIRVVVPPRGARRALGALRNVALEEARGSVVCQWDDDDLSHPRRLELQLRLLRRRKADAVTVGHAYHVFLRDRKLALLDWTRTDAGGLPGTIMFRKALGVRYPEARRREDTQLLRLLVASHKVLALRSPPVVYAYVFHGANTWPRSHHVKLVAALAAQKASSHDFESRIAELIKPT